MKDILFYIDAGNEHHKKGEFSLAIQNYSQALELGPDNIDVYSSRGLAYWHQQQFEQAILDFNKIITLDHKAMFAHYNRGNAYAGLELWDLAIADFNEEVALNYPDSLPCTYAAIAYAYEAKKMLDKAIEYYTLAIELKPQEPFWHMNRGYAHLANGRWVFAKYDFTSEIALDNPESLIAAYTARLTLRRYNNQPELVIPDCSIVLQKDAKNVDALENRALAYYKIGQYREAIKDLSVLIKLQPENALFYIRRGDAYLQRDTKNSYERAIADYTRALERNPENLTRTYKLRANAYRALGKRDEADEDLKQAEIYSTGNPELDQAIDVTYSFKKGM